jgi:hypothetical protein
VRRPHKPFAVEVKRGKKSPSRAAVSPALAFKQAEPSAAVRPPLKARPAASTPERAKPERRILEAIVEPPTIDVAEPVVAPPVVAPRKRRVGRPPKAPRLVEPKVDRVSPPRDEEFLVYSHAPREAFFLAESPDLVVTPRRGAKKSPSEAVHVPHGARGEASAGLPRGERWKRRLPKVLW